MGHLEVLVNLITVFCTGFDVTSSMDCGRYEIHVSGDVAKAFDQYLMMTGDEQILTAGRLKEAIFEIADFWVSRSTYNNSLEKFEILGNSFI